MPTVDSIPYKPEWLDMYLGADGVFGYTEWGLGEINKAVGNRLNVQMAAYPGVDLNTFTPMNKPQLRQALGIPEDAFIIGTVMRNQKRKLYPELFKAFKKFLDEAPEEI